MAVLCDQFSMGQASQHSRSGPPWTGRTWCNIQGWGCGFGWTHETARGSRNLATSHCVGTGGRGRLDGGAPIRPVARHIGRSQLCRSEGGLGTRVAIAGKSLKSAKPTGTHPLPRRLRSRPRDQRVRQDDRIANTPARTIIKNLVSGAAPAPEPWERVAHGGSSGNRSGPSHVPQGVFRRLAGLSAVDPCNPPVTLVDLVAVVGDARLDQEPIRRRRVVLSYNLVGRVGIRAAAHAM